MFHIEIILASKSPRRQQLVKDLGFPFKVAEIDVEETYPEHLAPEKVPEYLAELKARSYTKELKNQVLITADTIVLHNNQILGKPRNQTEAKKTLKMLSGKTHQVITGVSLCFPNQTETFSSITNVEFYSLTDEQINYYIENFLVSDKAGSYAIQEWLGKIAVKEIRGDFYNVTGLPVSEIFQRIIKYESQKI